MFIAGHVTLAAILAKILAALMRKATVPHHSTGSKLGPSRSSLHMVPVCEKLWRITCRHSAKSLKPSDMAAAFQGFLGDSA